MMAEHLGGRHIYSAKPNPARLAAPEFDEEPVRRDARRFLEAARGCRLELIMKDNHTLRGEPGRVRRWVEIVRGEIDRVWG